jgi:hypothetical protein
MWHHLGVMPKAIDIAENQTPGWMDVHHDCEKLSPITWESKEFEVHKQ